jgi:hypothetical protein
MQLTVVNLSHGSEGPSIVLCVHPEKNILQGLVFVSVALSLLSFRRLSFGTHKRIIYANSYCALDSRCNCSSCG